MTPPLQFVARAEPALPVVPTFRKTRPRRGQDARTHALWQAVDEAIHYARHHHDETVRTHAHEIAHAVWCYKEHLEAQTAALRAQVLDLLACDGVVDEARARAVAVLTPEGRRDRVRDAKLLAPEETDLVQAYRVSDYEVRTLLRVVLTRLGEAGAR